MKSEMIPGSAAQQYEWARYQMMRARESRDYAERLRAIRIKYRVVKMPAWKENLLKILAFLALARQEFRK